MRRIVFLLVVLVCSATVFGQQDVTQGSLLAANKKGVDLGMCPLKTTSVKTEISGFLARVNVRQHFENSFSEAIEAVYVFPLSQNGAVDSMTMTVGERVIRGQIMKREDARQMYETAKAEGKTASLLDQERPNIFTQSVANIMPGESVVIEISYVETLKYEDGAYEFVFPMTIGPRYIPAGVTDAAKVTPPIALTRAGHDISVEVSLNAGVPVEDIRSTSHSIDQVNLAPSDAKVTLRSEKVIPNKDFILRYDVTGKRIEDAMLTHRDARGGFFTLMLLPPDKVATEDRTPKEIVFVLDTSGSMSGFPIEKAKEAMKLSLDGLYPEDTFNVIAFAGDTAILFEKPVPATRANLDAAQRFVDGQYGSGGTEMMRAIKAALDPSDSTEHLRIVCFMTDGQVGNDDEIVAEVQRHPKARVFSFGIGSSVNRSLLDRIAQEGRGEAEYVALEDDGSKAARKFYERVRTPMLTDLSIDWNGMPVADVYPNRLSDLFSAKPVIIHGRYAKGASGTIKLKGKVAGQPYERSIDINMPEVASANDVLATLWARTRIDEISSERSNAPPGKGAELAKQITDIGLEFRLLTAFTSFVAVEDRIVNQNGASVKIQVPAVLPEGMSPDNATVPAFGGGGGGVGMGSGNGSGSGLGSGSVSAVVEVVASNEIDQSSTVSGSNITTENFSNIPTSRTAKGLYTIAPTATRSGLRNASGSDRDPSVGGSSGPENTFIIDGASATKSRSKKRGKVSGRGTGSGTGYGSGSGSGAPPPPARSLGVVGAAPANATISTLPTTPEAASERRLKEKLHSWVYDLVSRISKRSAAPGSNEAMFVHNGNADIQIELTVRSPAVINKLKTLGFEVTGEKGKTGVTGIIAIDKLAALADIDEVKLILPRM